MLGSLILAYIQYVIMLTELQKVLSQELKRLCSKKNMAMAICVHVSCMCSNTTPPYNGKRVSLPGVKQPGNSAVAGPRVS